MIEIGQWGTKGAEYRPDRCEHEVSDGCMWCCQRCNTDTHRCPGCGTIIDHLDNACDDCKVEARAADLKSPEPELWQICEHRYVEDVPMHSTIKWSICFRCGHVDEASISDAARARLDAAGWSQ